VHALLRRQLKRLGMSGDAPPQDPAVWSALLERVAATYEEADQDRYTLERSMEISSTEMQRLYHDLERSSATQLAAEHEKLHRTAATLSTMVDASPDGILVVDANRDIVSYNRRYCELWNLTVDEVRGSPAEILRARVAALTLDPDRFLDQLRAVYASDAEHCRGEFHLRDGRVFEFRSRAVRLASGTAFGHVWFLSDVTDAKLAASQLREAKEAAEQSSRAKSGFLANMSHEMRTPLNAILGFARILDAARIGPLTDRQREYVRYILHAGNHMLTLVNDLLDLRRIEEGRESIAIMRLDLAPVLDSAIEMVKPLVEERQHELVLELEPTLPQAVADRRAVIQILVNLLSNAVKFTPPRGRIAVNARASAGVIHVAVTDSGPGIPHEHQSRLFTYYEQLGAKQDLHMKGSGIGLALTRALVEKLGGHIDFKSAPGEGSTFAFSLPGWTEAA
jgi:PAS domain S-box-containing protein